jgi:NAD(P)-dependent dehydrogenase (short-subunit alcohol dehydrogenase family)
VDCLLATRFVVGGRGLTEALKLELRPLGIHATVIEPGFFRTDFLDARSLSVSPSQIDDYADTACAMRSFAANASMPSPAIPPRWHEH